jgi:hypothetical protein
VIAAAAAADPESFERGAAGDRLERIVERGRTAGRDYTCVVHRDAGGTSWLEQWTVHGGAHAWSGGSEQGSFSAAAGPDASSEMLRFFLQHARRSSVERQRTKCSASPTGVARTPTAQRPESRPTRSTRRFTWRSRDFFEGIAEPSQDPGRRRHCISKLLFGHSTRVAPIPALVTVVYI